MVKALETYIVTNGNGRQAVDFYKDVFQADLVNMMTWEEMDPNCLEDRKDLIINAQLIFDGIRLQISMKIQISCINLVKMLRPLLLWVA